MLDQFKMDVTFGNDFFLGGEIYGAGAIFFLYRNFVWKDHLELNYLQQQQQKKVNERWRTNKTPSTFKRENNQKKLTFLTKVTSQKKGF